MMMRWFLFIFVLFVFVQNGYGQSQRLLEAGTPEAYSAIARAQNRARMAMEKAKKKLPGPMFCAVDPVSDYMKKRKIEKCPIKGGVVLVLASNRSPLLAAKIRDGDILYRGFIGKKVVQFKTALDFYAWAEEAKRGDKNKMIVKYHNGRTWKTKVVRLTFTIPEPKAKTKAK
jgi:hypothetical protein